MNTREHLARHEAEIRAQRLIAARSLRLGGTAGQLPPRYHDDAPALVPTPRQPSTDNRPLVTAR